jgi:prepilin-type N-terminal cleavage/methylation domain-containing protein
MNRKNRGFTLIELLVVIAVIGVLASVIIASINSTRHKSRNARRVSDMQQLVSAFNLGLEGAGGLPDNGSDFACVSQTCTGGFASYAADSVVDAFLLANMSAKPTDPIDSTRGYNGYVYSFAWPGGTSYDGATFEQGSIIEFMAEPPLTTASCGRGRVWNVTSNYIECIYYIAQ